MKKLLLTLCTTLLTLSASAQVVTVKGVATVTYAAAVTPADKEKAYMAAQVASIERYFAENGEAESENFEAIQPRIEANLDKFIMSTTVLNEQDQPGLRKYSIAVRTELNVAKLRTTLRGASPTARIAGGEKSPMVFVFIGREVAGVKAFDDRVVKRAELTVKADVKSKNSTTGSEGESIKANSISTNASKTRDAKVDAQVTANLETGGSTNRKTDEMSYRLLEMASHKTSVTSVFSQSGFAGTDSDLVLADADIKALKADFSKGSDLAPSTMRGIVATLKKVNIPLLVLATFDAGTPAMDSATGLQRVSVSVTARVLDVSGQFPREVASVPPVQYFALGSDNAVASTKALKDAATAATREIVSRLNAAGVR